MVIARRLAEVRQLVGWSQTRLADEVRRFGGEATKVTISNVERDERQLRAEELVQWSAALNVRPSMLVTWNDPSKPIQLFPGLETDSRRVRMFFEGRYPLNAGWPGLAPTPEYFARVADDIREAHRYPLISQLVGLTENLIAAFAAGGVDEDHIEAVLEKLRDGVELALAQWKDGVISTYDEGRLP